MMRKSTINAEMLDCLKADPRFVPITHYAVLKPLPNEVGSFGGVTIEDYNGVIVKRPSDKAFFVRLFLAT